jgi:hypothetical protein
MRFIVEQKHTVRSRNTTVLSGVRCASRLTRLSSVPIAQALPAGAASSVLMMNSVDPTRSAASTTSCRHSGVHQHGDAGHALAHLGDGRSVKRPCTEQWPFQSTIFASRSCSAVRPAAGLARVVDDAVVERQAQLEHGGVAAEVLVGHEQHPLARARTPSPARAWRWTTCRRCRRAGR